MVFFPFHFSKSFYKKFCSMNKKILANYYE